MITGIKICVCVLGDGLCCCSLSWSWMAEDIKLSIRNSTLVISQWNSRHLLRDVMWQSALKTHIYTSDYTYYQPNSHCHVNRHDVKKKNLTWICLCCLCIIRSKYARWSLFFFTVKPDVFLTVGAKIWMINIWLRCRSSLKAREWFQK